MVDVTEVDARWPLAISALVAGLLLAALGVWWLALPEPIPDSDALQVITSTPVPAFDGTPAGSTTGSPTPTPSGCTKTVPLLVMTFNIHHAARGGALDLEQVATEIEAVNPDVVALQEVDSGNRRSAYVDEAAWLGKRLGLGVLWGPNVVRGKSSYGNALLTRLPILAQQNLRLPNLAHLEPRGLLLATLDVYGVPVVVGATHFQHRPSEPRTLEAAYVVRALSAQPAPRLLLGDLNDEPGTRPLLVLGRLMHDLWPGVGAGQGWTHPVHHPDRRIDFVLGDASTTATQAGVLVSRVSDHRAVWAWVTATAPVDCAAARK